MLSVQPGLRGRNDLHVGRKMATFQLLFQSGRAKDLSAPLCTAVSTTRDIQKTTQADILDLTLKSVASYDKRSEKMAIP